MIDTVKQTGQGLLDALVLAISQMPHTIVTNGVWTSDMLSVPQNWPHRAHSEMVNAGGIAWHVQRFGSGPVVFLIHGTAASTHSFRAVAAALAGEFEIIMADLPGHGFTSPMDVPSLPQVARGLGDLIRKLGAEPAVVAGHSAGAAIALRMVLDGYITPQAVMGLAPALEPFGGDANGLASRFTKLAFLNPIAPRVLAFQANARRVNRIIETTGSHLNAEGIDYYVRLLQRSEHVAGALRLMANWDLRPLLKDLPALSTPVTFIVGEADQATPARGTERAAERIADARIVRLAGQGHLAHEEDPETTAKHIRSLLPPADFQRSA